MSTLAKAAGERTDLAVVISGDAHVVAERGRHPLPWEVVRLEHVDRLERPLRYEPGWAGARGWLVAAEGSAPRGDLQAEEIGHFRPMFKRRISN